MNLSMNEISLARTSPRNTSTHISHVRRKRTAGGGVVIATSSDHDLLNLGNRSSSSLAPTHLSFREWLLTVRVVIVQGHKKYTPVTETQFPDLEVSLNY